MQWHNGKYKEKNEAMSDGGDDGSKGSEGDGNSKDSDYNRNLISTATANSNEAFSTTIYGSEEIQTVAVVLLHPARWIR